MMYSEHMFVLSTHARVRNKKALPCKQICCITPSVCQNMSCNTPGGQKWKHPEREDRMSSVVEGFLSPSRSTILTGINSSEQYSGVPFGGLVLDRPC